MSDPFDLGQSGAGQDRASDGRAAFAADAPYLDALNDEQRLAVVALEGPVLVLAGAGTGKTRVLITRLAHILALGRAFPGQILAVTFTNKAAREMFDRVGDLIGGSADGLWLGTFHAICSRILRRHGERIGLDPGFTILDSDDQLRTLKQVMAEANIDEKRWPARGLLAVIQRWKDQGLGPDKVPAGRDAEYLQGRAVELYRAYQARLKAVSAVDFGDLLLHCLTLFLAHEDVLADFQRRWRYILVDEYQDANVAQYLWLRLLAQGGGNLCCVGDDDQSIYGWRGAEVGNILRFEKDFPGAQVVRLERNYRSTGHILGAASGLIANNEGRFGKTLWTEAEAGARVKLRGIWDGEEEARLIAEEIEALHAHKHNLNEIAILVRAGAQTREFEERFVSVAIPYRVVGGLRFYERQEIRDAVAYLRVINQPGDDLAFERIINLPRRGIGATSLRVMHQLARARGIPLGTAAEQLVDSDELSSPARNGLKGLLGLFAAWRALAEAAPPAEIVEAVLDQSGYLRMWRNGKSADAPGRVENLNEFVTALAEFDSLGEFLDHVSLVMEHDQSTESEAVSLMTLHAAKGLEFDIVFLPGWEEGLFPHQRALDENGHKGLEEERRLAYVGMTRGRKQVHISYAANRRLFNQWQSAIPSRFVDELPDEHVERHTSLGLYGGAGAAGFQRTARAKVRRAKRPGDAAKPAEGVEQASTIQVGDRVFHQKFGYGKVTDVDVDKLEIAFDKAGSKKVMDSFVEPA